MRRILYIGIGLIVAGLVATFVDADEVEWSAKFLLVVLVEMFGSAVVWALNQGRPSPSLEVGDAAPADGVVPIVALPGVRSTANTRNSSIGLYRPDADEEAPVPRARHLEGPLRGRVGIFAMFVGRDGLDWSDPEIAEAYEAAAKAGRWIEREAARWGAPVNVELIGTYFAGRDDRDEPVALVPSSDPYAEILDEADADVRGIAGASRASASMGFPDFGRLVASVDPRSDHDRTAWLVHIRRAGRSSAVREDRFRFPGVGIAFCMARESSASEPLGGAPFVDPATIAHELLHLFGATDKYGTSLANFSADEVGPRDIMRLSGRRLSGFRIDALTAREIGWTLAGSPRGVRPEKGGKRTRPASRRSRGRA